VKSHTTERFREAFGRLPPAVQQRARDAYRLFGGDPGDGYAEDTNRNSGLFAARRSNVQVDSAPSLRPDSPIT
jgi:hypothetical protein